MIRVLYLLNHAGKAGTEKYVYSLIDSFSGKKISAYFVYNEEGLLLERLKQRKIETYQLTMKHPYDIVAAMKLAKYCRDKGIELIHTHYLRENYIALLSKFFNPFVKVVYTSHFILPNNLITRISNRFVTLLQSRTIAVCTPGRDMLIKNGNYKRKITLIFNGVDLKNFRQIGNSAIRTQFGIDPDEFVFVCASRFAHDKGHRFLVEAVALLKEKTQDKFRLLLGGDGPLLEEVQTQVEALGLTHEVIFPGFRENIKELFAVANAYINSSEHEALSFLILEAMAAGLPLIVTNMAGNIDIVNDDTDCGLLVEYNNPESMADAMLSMMVDNDLRKRLVKNAKETVRTKFNLKNVVNETYKVYLECCRQN